MMINIPQNKLMGAIEALQIAELFVSHDQIIRAVPDKIYRTGTTQKPKGKNGWFKLLHDGVADFITICYGNFETNSSLKYHINLNDAPRPKLSTVERQELQRKMQERIARDNLQRSQIDAKKRAELVRLFNSFKYCQEHSYLTRKGIENQFIYQFRIDDSFNNNKLVIPFVDNKGCLHGYQTIAPDGTKRFNGSVGGCYWQYPIKNPNAEVFNQSNSFYIIGEGLATCLSVYEAINTCFDSLVFLPMVLCAFNAGNLTKVISATKHHKVPYLLLVDNDNTKTSNTGIETAKSIIANHSDATIYPISFSNGDANDYILAYGMNAFIELLNSYHNPLNNPYTDLSTNEVNI